MFKNDKWMVREISSPNEVEHLVATFVAYSWAFRQECSWVLPADPCDLVVRSFVLRTIFLLSNILYHLAFPSIDYWQLASLMMFLFNIPIFHVYQMDPDGTFDTVLFSVKRSWDFCGALVEANGFSCQVHAPAVPADSEGSTSRQVSRHDTSCWLFPARTSWDLS